MGYWTSNVWMHFETPLFVPQGYYTQPMYTSRLPCRSYCKFVRGKYSKFMWSQTYRWTFETSNCDSDVDLPVPSRPATPTPLSYAIEGTSRSEIDC